MDASGIGPGLGALGFWLFIAAIVVGGMWYAIREREAEHETLRRIVESGQTLDDVLLNKLIRANKRVDHDLRIGAIIVLAIAPGLAVMGFFVAQVAAQAFYPLLGASLLTGFVGAGLMIASKMAERWYREDGTSSSGASRD